MSSPVPFDPAAAERIAREGASTEGALLPVLHALQHHFGCVPAAAVPIVADVLNLSRAEVHGVVSFYHDFRSEPAGEHHVKLCLAEACQARGEDALGVAMGQTAPDRSVTLEPVYCLGLCGNGPAALVDGRPYADLGGRGFDRCMKAVVR
jgi:formate dehydrogenase subunit gamma